MKRILSICAVLLVAVTAMGQNRYGIKYRDREKVYKP